MKRERKICRESGFQRAALLHKPEVFSLADSCRPPPRWSPRKATGRISAADRFGPNFLRKERTGLVKKFFERNIIWLRQAQKNNHRTTLLP